MAVDPHTATEKRIKSMRRFRAGVTGLIVISLIPVTTLFSRVSSTTSTIFGRYTVRYALFLAIYVAYLVCLGLLAILATPSLHDSLLCPVRWLRRRYGIVILIFYGLIELWYLVQRLLFKTRFFGIKGDYVTILVFVALLELYFAGVILFAGREGDDLRNTLIRTGIGVGAGAVIFGVFSFIYALVINRSAYVPYHALWWELHRPDPRLGYALRPDLEAFPYPFPTEDGDYFTTSTDAQGFRNEGDADDAPLAVVGDSIIYGMGVPDAAVWSSVINREYGIHAANYGVIGYSLGQYNLIAERYLPRGSHRVVVYAVFANDMSDSSIRSRQDVRLIQRWSMGPYRSPITYTIKFFFGDSPASKIKQCIQEHRRTPPSVESQEAAGDMPYGLQPTCVLRAYTEPEKEVVATELDRAIELASELNYTLVVVTIPTRENIYSDYLIPVCDTPVSVESVISHEEEGYAFICDYMQARGLLCYNMTEDMHRVAQETGGLLYGRSDDHFSPLGHEAFAQLLADYLKEHGLIEG
jgi:hypothetical protein